MTGNRVSRRAFNAGALGLIGAAPFTRYAAAQAVRMGGRLVVKSDSEAPNLNPAIVASNGVFYVASKVIEPLAEMSFTGPDMLEPRLATSWTGSADGRSVTFKLREGVTWHDGRPFTSADVAFSATQVWAKLQNLGRIVFKDLEGAETPDANTVVLRFAKPTPFSLIKNSLPALTAVLPKHLYEGTDINANPANLKLVGTGPFKFGEHQQGQFYRLDKNPAYWDRGKPYLDQIIYRVLPDAGATAAALEANEIQLAAFSAVSTADLKRMAALPGMAVVTKGYEGLMYQLTVEINHRRKELADVRVRRAIAHAIDRKQVVDTIFLGFGAEAATGPVPHFDRAIYTGDVPQYAFDPRRAEALLDEAGYRRGADGMRFALNLLPAPFFEQTRQFGDYLRQALRTIGIDARIANNDTPSHLKAVYTDRAFDLATAATVYRSDPAISTTILYRSGLPAGVPFGNQYGYESKAMDEVIDKAAVAIDGGERTRLYQQFQKLAAEDLPIIQVAEFTFTTVARTSVQNLGNNPRWPTSNWADTWLQA